LRGSLVDGSPFGGIPRNWKPPERPKPISLFVFNCSPFGGIPRNWKPPTRPPHRIGGASKSGSPFGGIPRNWKQKVVLYVGFPDRESGSPFGGIPRNWKPAGRSTSAAVVHISTSSPFGGIPRNWKREHFVAPGAYPGSPFGGIPRNWKQLIHNLHIPLEGSPFGGIPRNWKQQPTCVVLCLPRTTMTTFPLRGDP